MFESTVGNGANKLGLQQEIAEAGRVDANVAAFGAGDGQVALLLLAVGNCAICASRNSLVGLELLIGVVDEILFGGHCGWW